MPQAIVKSGHATQVTGPERRADLADLAARLRSVGVAVDIQITEYISGRRGIVWGESLAIYIAGTASSAVISSLVEDIYKQARNWALARFKKKNEKSGENGNPRPESFTIYGPDGQPLKIWRVDRNGEHEG